MPERGAPRRTGAGAKLWAGRFLEPTNPLVDAYTSSLDVDRRMAAEDVRGSIAHARMLAKQGIIPNEDAEKIIEGLTQVAREIETGTFEMDERLEDVHMNVEARLAQLIGPEAAGRLHTARSRNDQVVTDLRLWLKTAIAETIAALHDLERALVEVATENRRVVMPGYTHLQRAQPVLLAHHLLAYFEMFERDIGRFADCYARTDVMGLGSGALAGVPYPIDREMVAQELEFSALSANSIDAVSDRDFVAEYLAAAAIAMMHLSRLAEEVVLWSTTEFGYVELPDAFSTGSSIMPQKKNPDVAELARGKTGRVYGALVSLLTTMKGLPLAYNRDMQEDKAPLFEAYDTLTSSLEVMSELMVNLRFRPLRMRRGSEGYLLATDIADYLTRKGMPFREAHNIVGRLVAYAEDEGRDLSRISLEEYRRFSPLFEADVLEIDVWTSVRSRDVIGGTAPRRVSAALRRARAILRRREEA
ncbi:MAG TPA: argininosuccinate lyase [Dehalococcoidia bacterium]|nr:argininosuccinate lyase [Dehalococcoidia bacterium]